MKKLTLVFSLLIALIGFNANAAMYIVGTNPFGDWNPAQGLEMTQQADGTYTLDATLVQADIWFIFTEAIGSWTDVNGNRYDPGTGSDKTVSAGVVFTPVKGNTDKSFKFSGTVGEKYTFTFNPTTMEAMVDGYVEPITEFTYTVTGNSADIFGEAWNTTLAANDMTLDATDGLYKLVKNNVEIAGGFTLEYKVVQNHAWGTNWGESPNGGNQTYYFGESGTYNLTFVFDLENETVSLNAEKIQDGPEVDPITGDLFILGQVNGNNWNPSTGIEMATVDEDVYTLTDATFNDSGDGYAWFSFTSKLGENADDWGFAAYRRGAMEDGTLVEDGVNAVLADWGTSYAFKVLPGTYDVEVGLSSDYVKLTLKETPEPVVDDIYVFGDVNSYAWDPTQGVQMTYNEGIYTAEVNATMREGEQKAYIGFTKKLADPESETPWDDIAGFRFGPVSEGAFVMTEELLGVECDLATDGSYESIALPEGTWTVSVDMVNHKFTVNGTWPTDTIEPPVEENIYVFGDLNNYAWDPTQGVLMTYNEGIYTAEVTTTMREGVDKAYIGFTKKLADPESETPWDDIAGFRFGPVSEGAFEMTEELLGVECDLATDGSYESIALPEGTWTVTVDMVNHKFTVNGTWPTDTVTPEPYTGDVYILGEVNDNGGWFPNIGAKMTRDEENNVYTLRITTAGENVNEGEEIGYSYFSFTKQLAENDWENGGWDEITGYRFGAVTDGNPFDVTEEMLGTELDLVMATEPMAFKIIAGTWDLTLSVDNMKLIINKVDFMRGDVDMDGVVGISDVTRLVDYILSKDATDMSLEAADADMDGEIGIADVTKLVDFILSKSWD